MNQLKNLLGTAVAQATFDAGRIEWSEQGITTSYASRPQEIITPEKLREMVWTRGWNAGEYRRALIADLLIDSNLLSQIKCKLRCLLQDHIDPTTDRIGHTFPTGGGHESFYGYLGPDRRVDTWSSPLDSFTKSIIKAAAILGPEPITNQLSMWLEGEPVKYRIASVLNGVAFRDRFNPISGVQLEPLPMSVDELPVHLPTGRLRSDDYLGRTALYIDYEVSPALFRPPSTTPENSVAVRNVAGVDSNTVCQALSLESNTTVEAGFYWNHYLGPTGLVQSGGDSSWSRGRQRFELWPVLPSGSLVDSLSEGMSTLYQDGGTGPKLSEQRLTNTLKAVMALASNSSTRIAITRWMRSRNNGEDLEDRFIDLRIALEALYVRQARLSNNQGELGLRLSLCGAWHLGTDFEDRKDIRKKLNRVYGVTSGAVHKGDITWDSENLELLSKGQDYCRRGIMKLLREGSPKDWLDLILGAEAEAR